MKRSQRLTTLNRQSRRKFLKTAGSAMAAGAFGAYPLRGWAADPVNIGGLYPVTGSMGTAILLVEQNVSRALTLVQRAYVLESGKVIMHGSSAELANNKQVQAAYLGM